MISAETIRREIDEIESHGKTTYAQCERLAWLYIVLDHVEQRDVPTAKVGGTEFLDACAGRPHGALMRVLDEHMEALKVVQPREYEAVLARIRSL